MTKRLTNKIRHRASLLKLVNGVDENDRPAETWEPVRTVYYSDLGVTATEKYLSEQAKSDVVKRIKIRLDNSITQKNNRFRIRGVDFLVTRIFVLEDEKTMEVSLDYVT